MGTKFSGLTPQGLFLFGFIKVQMTSKMHVHIVLVKITSLYPAAISAAEAHASSRRLMNIQKKSPLGFPLMRAC